MNTNYILSDTFEKMRNYLNTNNQEGIATVKYQSPANLRTSIDFAINETGISENEFLELIDSYLDHSVRTGNKQFFNQLYAGYNLPAFIGELITTLTNTSMYTYEVAPVATLIETEMIELMNQYTGYEKGDGIFVSGGSNANLIAMFSARNRIAPESRFLGYDRNQRLVAFVSDQAHYSFDTAANVLGIGSSQVIKIKSDEKGKMIPSELEKEIEASLIRGEKPFFVAATCATTLLGAYDPIHLLAPICKKHHIWLHADGSFGGSAILSKENSLLLKGIEQTDSFTWNPHKLMNIPLICSALLVKERGVLQHNITDINTDYIYHDIDYIEDLGKKSIQCGRRVDAVKLWFAWKYYGKKGYEARIDRLFHMAQYAETLVNNSERLQLMAPRQSFSVCFRYKPTIETNIDAFNLELRESLRKSGKSIVNYGYLNNELVIRLVAANGELSHEDIDEFFFNIINIGHMLEAEKNETTK